MRRKLNGTQSAKSAGFGAFQTSGATLRLSDQGMTVTQKIDFVDYTGRACLKTHFQQALQLRVFMLMYWLRPG
ncbi:MAG: hypothetical protein ABFD10_23345 [Prolixibacteraceae bacterium]